MNIQKKSGIRDYNSKGALEKKLNSSFANKQIEKDLLSNLNEYLTQNVTSLKKETKLIYTERLP